MIEKLTKDETLTFCDLTQEEKERRGILGVLYGPIASIVQPTRNGRKYSEELWARIFDEGLPKELLDKGGIPGELDHPEGRLETCPDRIAIMLPEKPKKDDSGHLVARFDIIDTPCGHIAYSLAKYGFKLGVSSRGDGTVEENFDGTEDVIPADYKLSAFDLVLIPACEDARLNLISESLDTKKLALNKEINEVLNSATHSQKEIIQEALSKLNINYSAKVSSKEDMAAVDDGAILTEDLQKALKDKTDADKMIRELQEKLSVSYAREVNLEEKLSKYKSAVIQLGEGSRKCKALEKQLDSLRLQLTEKQTRLSDQIVVSKKLTESRKAEQQDSSFLKESISSKDAYISKLEGQISKLTEGLAKQQDIAVKEKESHEETLQEARKNFAIKQKEYSDKLNYSNKLIEKYKNIAHAAVDRYIESKATVVGVTANEIKSRLNESYSFRDIDNVCDDLMSYSVNVSKLPVDITRGKKSIKAIPSINESLQPKTNVDDEIDDSLFRIVSGLNN